MTRDEMKSEALRIAKRQVEDVSADEVYESLDGGTTYEEFEQVYAMVRSAIVIVGFEDEDDWS